MPTKKNSILITPEQPVLVLRISHPDGSSRNGFIWPQSGPVSCPDWKETEECGNGLHGWLHGEGDHSVADSDLFTMPDARWLAVEVPAYVQLDGKVKFPAGNVVCSGDRMLVTEYLKAHGCTGSIIGGTATAGSRGTATAGYAGTATAGSRGTATAGDEGTATAGSRGTATAGSRGTATAGYTGTATAGYAGTATAGYAGTATAGDAGTATAGYAGTATAGYAGTATAGDEGAILIKRWNGKRYRFTLGSIGEDKDAAGDLLLAGTPYKLDDNGQFIKA